MSLNKFHVSDSNYSALILLVICFFEIASTGCASQTSIRTSDPAAQIYIDGLYRGTGSVKYSDTKMSGAKTLIRLQKHGCAPQLYTLSRDEEIDVAACAGALFIAPLFWLHKYKDEHVLGFACERPGSRSSV